MIATERLTHLDDATIASYRRGAAQAIALLDDLGTVVAVVGIPFSNEVDTLPGVVDTASRSLGRLGLRERSAVLCVGGAAGGGALELALARAVRRPRAEIGGLLLEQGLEGRGWAARALLEGAARVGAPLVLLPPDLSPQTGDADEPGGGFAPHWVDRLLAGVTVHGQDLLLARFDLSRLSSPVEGLVAAPILAGVFGLRLAQPSPFVCALSVRAVQTLAERAGEWTPNDGTQGFDSWLATEAVVAGLKVCEAPLGRASFRHAPGNLKRTFRQVTQVLFEQCLRHAPFWLDRGHALRSPQRLGPFVEALPEPSGLDAESLVHRFRLELFHFEDTLLREVVPEDLRGIVQRMADSGAPPAVLGAEDWVRALQCFIVAFGFETRYRPEDLVDGLFPFFLARLLAFDDGGRRLESALLQTKGIAREEARSLAGREAHRGLRAQAELMGEGRERLCREWQARDSAARPYLPRLGAWELVPGVGVVVPQEVLGRNGGSAWAHEAYKDLLDRYRAEYAAFVTEELQVDDVTAAGQVLEAEHGFLRRLDGLVERALGGADLWTLDGARAATALVCEGLCRPLALQLTEEAALELLMRAPPRELMVRLGADGVERLVGRMSAKDAVAAAAFGEHERYLDRALDVLERRATRVWFERVPIEPLVLDLAELAGADEVLGASALYRLAGRVVTSPYALGRGGDLPTLWFVLRLLKRAAGIELFGRAWEMIAASGVDFSSRLAATIRGHWGRTVTSAHHAFENRQQRLVAEHLEGLATALWPKEAHEGPEAGALRAAAGVYGLSITLPDATFVPLSAWTWASYSYRGGAGSPTPLSSLVERDWATRDFLVRYLERAASGDGQSFDDRVLRMVAAGAASDDLVERVLGSETVTDPLVLPRAADREERPAGRLRRPVDRPILSPVPGHAWESKYVLNAGAVRLDGTVHILCRAFGDDRVSRIGLAWSRDGVAIDGRLEVPVFEPAAPEESAGCEDPRVVVIGDDLWMLYTAFDGRTAQIAMASIPVQALLERRFDAWVRHGMALPGLWNKDAVVYPRTIGGRYAVYHRMDPNMWVTYIDRLECPWPKIGHRMVAGPRSGMMWDGVKIGAGAQPIETTLGWLNIYHGVDYEQCYRLGVMLMDRDDPARILYRSPNPILEPEADFELGSVAGADFWVPGVVFTCGAVSVRDVPVLGLDDEVLVYYGAADTAVGVAVGALRDLVPTAGPLAPA